jgi:hypothetical protein
VRSALYAGTTTVTIGSRIVAIYSLKLSTADRKKDRCLRT